MSAIKYTVPYQLMPCAITQEVIDEDRQRQKWFHDMMTRGFVYPRYDFSQLGEACEMAMQFGHMTCRHCGRNGGHVHVRFVCSRCESESPHIHCEDGSVKQLDGPARYEISVRVATVEKPPRICTICKQEIRNGYCRCL